MKKFLFLMLSAALSVSVTSCKKSSSDNSGLMALLLGSSEFSVVSTTPSNNATSITLNSSIAVNFSENVLGTTVDTGTFQISPAVTGSFDVTGSTVTFTPGSDLAENTQYTVTVTTGVESAVVAGVYLKTNKVFRFTTGTAPDVTAPTVSSTNPTDNASDVAINHSIVITFSEPIAAASVAGHYTISPSAGAVDVSVSGATLTINPDSDLSYDTIYTVTVTAGGITDLAGNPIAADYELNFVTTSAPDTTGPQPLLTNPSDEATGQSAHTTITISFNENILSSSVNSTNVSISPSVTGDFNVSGSTVTFTPDDPLAYNQTYTITLPVGGVKDLAGNGIESEFSFSFTTEAEPDTTHPTISQYSPEDAATGVTLNPTVMVYFSEAMLSTSVTSSNFKVTYDDGSVHQVSGTYSVMDMAGMHIVSWTPNSNLSLNTEYTVTLTQGGITDLAGNGWTGSGDLEFSFTTKTSIDTTPPTVTGSNPSDEQSLTAADITMSGTSFATINIYFSDEMDATTISSNVTLQRGATIITASALLFPVDTTGKTVIVMLNASDLTAGDYTVTVHGGTGGVANSDGYEMVSDYSFDFTITE